MHPFPIDADVKVVIANFARVNFKRCLQFYLDLVLLLHFLLIKYSATIF